MKFLLGFTIGIAIGLLLAPAPGSETRQKMRQRLGELRDLPEKKAAAFAVTAKEKTGELGGRIGRQGAKGAVEAVRNDLPDNNDRA